MSFSSKQQAKGSFGQDRVGKEIAEELSMSQGRGGKTGRALFECPPAFPLSHACIVTDKLQQIPFWVGEVQRANMQPLVYGRIYLQSQALEAHFLGFEIFKRYIERNVMEHRLCWAQL